MQYKSLHFSVLRPSTFQSPSINSCPFFAKDPYFKVLHVDKANKYVSSSSCECDNGRGILIYFHDLKLTKNAYHPGFQVPLKRERKELMHSICFSLPFKLYPLQHLSLTPSIFNLPYTLNLYLTWYRKLHHMWRHFCKSKKRRHKNLGLKWAQETLKPYQHPFSP